LAVFRVIHDSFRRNSLRYLETSDSFEVGTFIRLNDAEELFRGDFLIVEVERPGYLGTQHIGITLFPLSVQMSAQRQGFKLYKLVSRVGS
jgi:hypothetical protein